MKRIFISILLLSVLSTFFCFFPSGNRQSDPTNAYGQYYELIKVMNCPTDKDNFGDYNDFGYWDGDEWCGQRAVKGYWVYVYPKWYVWQNKR